ncbi:hypothetical protein, partial [Endozoicomonas sp. YOMI1]|uniref:hypothetical protein n=1 Tax=Endozoicomonas sp. YOMI1 TaxID=2828739 RepID=UPI002147D046
PEYLINPLTTDFRKISIGVVKGSWNRWGLKIPLCYANRTTIYLTKRNFYPQFLAILAILAMGAILGQPPRGAPRGALFSNSL